VALDEDGTPSQPSGKSKGKPRAPAATALQTNAAYEQWRHSHQPFHWFVEFYGILAKGGFDVIVGNPPYVDLKDIKNYYIYNFATSVCKNLYAMIIERMIALSKNLGFLGYIVPVSSISTDGYEELQKLLINKPITISSFDDRPSRLFEGLEHIRLSIHLVFNKYTEVIDSYVTECIRWNASERSDLFSKIQYQHVSVKYLNGSFPKISKSYESDILNKIWGEKYIIKSFALKNNDKLVYYSRKVQNFLQVLDFVPQVYDGCNKLREPSEFKTISFSYEIYATLIFCLLNLIRSISLL
jgi:hypothetical protein